MKKNIVLAFLLLGQMLYAQRNLTIEEATLGQFSNFHPETLHNPQWKSNKQLTYLSNDRRTLMIRSEKDNWNAKPLLTLQELELAFKSTFPKLDFSLNYFPDFEWKQNSLLHLQLKFKEQLYLIDLDIEQKSIVNSFSIDSKAQDPIISRDNNYVAWLDDNNIKITTNKGKVFEVTQDKTNDFLNGSKDTHRNEFGITQGMWWSPKQDQLLFYRKDQSMVSNYPLVNFGSRVAETKQIKYPMAGMASEHVKLVIYDVYTNQQTVLQTGEPLDQFLTMVTWDPSGNYVYVGVLNREQNHLKINQYNAATGAFEKTLLEEKYPSYVEPLNPLYFNPRNGKEFIYLSEKDGYRQAYLYNTEGKLLKNLGFEDVVVTDFLGFDEEGKNIFYIGTANHGLDRQLYKATIRKEKTEIITTTSGTHKVTLNPSKTLFLDQFSNLHTPNETYIQEVNQKFSLQIIQAKDPYQGIIDMPKTELIQLTAADGQTTLNGRIIYPTHFDENKQYPVMVYVYGGPHAQLIQNKWLGGASLFFHYMAQKGYIVFTVDNRGSYNRGRDFEHVIHRQLGQVEMEDQMKGIAYLMSKPFVNRDQIGVYGWSFGGFMTTTLSIHHPEVFKVAVAGGPVMDWKYYEVMYGERYMDTPQENPQGYEKTSLINKANRLNNKLLLIHGAQDPVVVQQHSMEFVEACIKAGKQVDYFLYPSHEHNVLGRDRVHLNQKIATYFFTHLAQPRE